LNSVECGSFLNLISDDPEGESVGEDLIFANPSNEAVVFPGGVEWDWVE
jgi:hypothetical protein